MDALILRHLRETLQLRSCEVTERWVGTYPSSAETDCLIDRPDDATRVVLVTSGTQGDKWLVKSGLAAGDLLIVEGLQKVKPGAPAKVAAAAPAAAPGAPAAAATTPAAKSAH